MHTHWKLFNPTGGGPTPPRAFYEMRLDGTTVHLSWGTVDDQGQQINRDTRTRQFDDEKRALDWMAEKARQKMRKGYQNGS